MSTSALVGTRADAELITAVRGGDVEAYGELFERHVDAARRLARQLVSAGDVDDLVSEAFVKVLGVLQRGGGPDVAFRAYLLTSVRRLRVDRLRASAKVHTTDEIEIFDPGMPFKDTTVEGFENAAAARAFASLPERWQFVLWHTEVEEQKPADLAVLLGMTPNSVSALAYRAREGLRQAFLNQHVADLDDDTCRWTHEHLGPYIRSGLAKRDAAKVEGHLTECRSCAGIYLEIVEVNSNLGAIIGPLLLGGAAAGYAAATSSVTAGSLLTTLLARGKDALVGHASGAALGGVATAVMAAGVVFVTIDQAPSARTTPPPQSAVVSDPPDEQPPTPTTTRPTADLPPRERTARTPARILVRASLAPAAAVSQESTQRPSPAATPSGVPATVHTAPADSEDSAGPTRTPTPAPAVQSTTPSASSTSPPNSQPTSQPGAQSSSQPGSQSSSQPGSQPGSQSGSQPGSQSTPPTTSQSSGSSPQTGGPTAEPTKASSPTPSRSPDPPPSPQATEAAPAVTRDLAIAINTVGRKALDEELSIATTGIPAGETATVTISGDNVMELTTPDPRCNQPGASQLVCVVDEATPIAVHTRRIPNRRASLTASVVGDGADSNPSDNSTTRVLASH